MSEPKSLPRSRHALRALSLACALAALPAASMADCLNFSTTMQDGVSAPGVYTSPEGYRVALLAADFSDLQGNPVQGFARMVDNVSCTGAPNGEGLWLSGRAMRALFMDGPKPVSEMSFHFCDYGGYENLSAGFEWPPKYAGDFATNPPPYVSDANGEQVDAELTTGDSDIGWYEGKMALTSEAELETALIGGQEMILLSVCVN